MTAFPLTFQSLEHSEDNFLHYVFLGCTVVQPRTDSGRNEDFTPGYLEQCLVVKLESGSCMICSQIGVSH